MWRGRGQGGVIKENQDVSSLKPTGLSWALPDWREGFVWRGGQDHQYLVKEKLCSEEWRRLTTNVCVCAAMKERQPEEGCDCDLRRTQQPPLPNIVSAARIAALAFSTNAWQMYITPDSLLPSGSNVLLVMGITETSTALSGLSSILVLITHLLCISLHHSTFSDVSTLSWEVRFEVRQHQTDFWKLGFLFVLKLVCQSF